MESDTHASLAMETALCTPLSFRMCQGGAMPSRSLSAPTTPASATVQENPAYKGKGGLTQKMQRRLTSAARCAIRMHSKESDTSRALHSLERDLINGPLHCFGYHDNCSPDFCSTARERLEQSSSSGSETDSDSSINDEADIDDTDLVGRLLTVQTYRNK